MDYTLVYKRAEQHVTTLYNSSHQPQFVYHNLGHTQSVVNRIKEIAGHYNLVENDMVILFVAAWFHDTGYLFEEPKKHEEKSSELMREFMRTEVADEDLVNSIADCIMATKPQAIPENLLQQILRDADTYNLGTKEFDTTNKLVFNEFKLRGNIVSKTEWQVKAIQLLENHQYYTAYCKELLTEKKLKNLKKLKKSLPETARSSPKNELVANQSAFTTKGIQTMLRLTSENHMKLSDMADGKANILISVNAIIISVILSVLLRRLQVDTHLTIPTMIFLTFSVVTIVVAILATRPKISEGTFNDEDVDAKKTNLLFFGNFYKTSQAHYEQAMGKMMIDPNYLYGSLVKDIFQLGVVLARKYKLIRWAYNIFMVGIIASVLAFGLAVFFYDSASGTISNSAGSPL